MPVPMEKLSKQSGGLLPFWPLRRPGKSFLPEGGILPFPAFPATMENFCGGTKRMEKFAPWRSGMLWFSFHPRPERSSLAAFPTEQNYGNENWRTWSTARFWRPAARFWSARPKLGFLPCRKKTARFYGKGGCAARRGGARALAG